MLPDVTATNSKADNKADNMVADDVLRDKVGIDPRRLAPVLDLAALGLVNMAWRNTVVED